VAGKLNFQAIRDYPNKFVTGKSDLFVAIVVLNVKVKAYNL